MTMIRSTMVAAVLALAAHGAIAAETEDGQNFPKLRSQQGLCEDITWSTRMIENHPALIEACREVVVAEGRKWARFEAKFVSVDDAGLARFSVRDRRDRSLESVLLQVRPGQVAYIDDKPVRFDRLRTTDAINLYMPENQYAFATVPSAMPLAAIVEPPKAPPQEAAPAPMAVPVETVAARDPLPRVLPQTAGPLPAIALSGLLFLLVGASLTLRRHRARILVSRSPT